VINMDDKRTALPEAFLERMQRLLGSEYEAFAASYEKQRQYGLRRNLLKGSEETFIKGMPFPLERISWVREGYYYDAGAQPGRHALHEAGAYYIQEPSAMAVAEIVSPRPGERILDLCAAPGGKSTQIAGKMQGCGLLVSNEVMGERARVLSQNVERMGIGNCVVCSESPERMAALFPAFFDRVLVDAPCSGEGMFRKDEAAAGEWNPAAVEMCAKRQALILEEAAKMVKPGGALIYSTCTFSPEENEGTVSAFLQAHEEYSIEETAFEGIFAPGRAEWVEAPGEGIEHTLRLWPHLIRGEGHYAAKLRKRGGASEKLPTEEPSEGAAPAYGVPKKIQDNGGAGKTEWNITGDKKLCKLTESFLREELGIGGAWMERHSGRITKFGDHIYLTPEEMPSLSGFRVLRPGLHLLTEKKNRFEPAHALARTLLRADTQRGLEITEPEAISYLRGESLLCEAEKGWTVLFYEGYALGYGKASGGQIKNHYPKGLRKSF